MSCNSIWRPICYSALFQCGCLGSPDILANCHGCNDLLHSFLLLLFLITVELCLELEDLPCTHTRKKASCNPFFDVGGGKKYCAALTSLFLAVFDTGGWYWFVGGLGAPAASNHPDTECILYNSTVKR